MSDELLQTECDLDEAELFEADKRKIYCANCNHCKLVPTPGNTTDQFYLRVRCTAGKWRKKLGEEKIYKYFSITRRSIEHCDAYEEMGDPVDFMRDLRKNLPTKDEVYDKWDNL